jgi:hypothetical protein
MKAITLILIPALAAAAAGEPVWPHNTGPMRHVMVSITDGVLHAHVEGGDEPVMLERFPGDAYAGAAGVLDAMAYSNQFGWMAMGFLDPGAGNSIMIEAVTTTPGLEVYEGGMRSMIPMHTFAPIFGTAGSHAAWDWPGTMVHHWYAASDNGDYQAAYRVFVADAGGQMVGSFGEAFATLHFRAVPAPGGACALAGLGLLACRRRRGGAS